MSLLPIIFLAEVTGAMLLMESLFSHFKFRQKFHYGKYLAGVLLLCASMCALFGLPLE